MALPYSPKTIKLVLYVSTMRFVYITAVPQKLAPDKPKNNAYCLFFVRNKLERGTFLSAEVECNFAFHMASQLLLYTHKSELLELFVVQGGFTGRATAREIDFKKLILFGRNP